MSITRKLLSCAASGSIAAASLALSTPASARPTGSPESYTVLTSGMLPVTTSTGKHLKLSLRATRFSTNSGGSDAGRRSILAVSLRGNGGHETHQWSFHLAPHSFTDVAGGSGALKTGDQIAPFGRMSLTITPIGPLTTQVCDNSNRNRVHRVALKGTLSLRTHSPGSNSWGKLAHLSVDFTHGKLKAGHGANVEEACAVIPCQGGLSWTASHGHLTLLGLDVATKGTKPVSRLEGDRLTRFATPAHASRSDTVITRAPPPTLTTAGNITTLHAKSAGGIATGSATIASHKHTHLEQGCQVDHLVGTIWIFGQYVAARQALTIHEQIFGAMTFATVNNASFIKNHVV